MDDGLAVVTRNKHSIWPGDGRGNHISDILTGVPVSFLKKGLAIQNPLSNRLCWRVYVQLRWRCQRSKFTFCLLSPSLPPPSFYRAISMRIFAVFAGKVGSCWCVTHVHVCITWTVWTHLWKPFPRACGSVPNVKTRYCLTDRVTYSALQRFLWAKENNLINLAWLDQDSLTLSKSIWSVIRIVWIWSNCHCEKAHEY